MKNTVYGVGLSIVTFILLLIITTVSGRMMRETEIRETLASAVENAVENAMESNVYTISNRSQFVSDVMENLAYQYHSTSEKVKIEVNKADHNKGILFIKATAYYKNPIGNTGSVSYPKKYIYATQDTREDRLYKITYKIPDENGGRVYREYYAKYKDEYPVPKTAPSLDGRTFKGWKDENGNTYHAGEFPETVSESQTYAAIFSAPEETTQIYNVTLSGKSEMTVNEKQKLSIVTEPADVDVAVKEYKSYNESIATVSSNGTVTAKKAGTVSITAKVQADGHETVVSINITVKELASIGVTAQSTFLNPTEGTTGKITVADANGDNIATDCTFKCSNEDVATVDVRGVVTPKEAGVADITIAHKNGVAKAAVPVIVAYTKSNEYVYDGETHQMEIDCPGAAVTYYTDAAGSNPSSVCPSYRNPGVYTTYFRLTYKGVSIDGSANLVIKKKPCSLTVEREGVELEEGKSLSEDTLIFPEEAVYRVSSKENADLSGLAITVDDDNCAVCASQDGTTLTIGSNPLTTENGKADVKVTFTVPESANYGETSFEMVIHIQNGIMSADIDSVTGDYDGKPHSIKVTARDLKLKDKNDTTESGTGETGAEGSGETGTEETVDPSLIQNAVITYSTTYDGTYTEANPSYTDAGEYTTYFKIVAPGYYPFTGSGKVKINKVEGDLALDKQELFLNPELPADATDEEKAESGRITGCIVSVGDGLSKDDVSATASSDKIRVEEYFETFSYSGYEYTDEDTGELVKVEGHTETVFAGFSISAKAGAEGLYTVTIEREENKNYAKATCTLPVYVSKTSAGLYDEDGALTIPWNELVSRGLNIHNDYTAYDHPSGDAGNRNLYEILESIKKGDELLYCDFNAETQQFESYDINNVKFSRLVVPATGDTIGMNALAGLENISRIEILPGIKTIKSGAFGGIINDEDLTTTRLYDNIRVPDGVETIASDAFSGAKSVCIADTSKMTEEAAGNAPWKAESLHSYSDKDGKCIYCGAGKPAEQVELTEGETYTLGGYEWVAAENKDGYTVLQSKGVTGGQWPGRTMAKFGNGNGYAGNIDGQDISGYDDKTTALYNSIKSAEYSEAKYGTGLYLISSTMAGTTEPNTQGSGSYWLALKAAAYDNSTFGASDRYSWLGTVTDNDLAWFVSWNGDISDQSQDNAYVIAPAFNLDTSKVSLKGNALTVK